MTWCQYRKLADDADRARTAQPQVGAASVDLGSVVLVLGGLGLVVHLATTKRVAGYGR